jgi:hypothetical protein
VLLQDDSTSIAVENALKFVSSLLMTSLPPVLGRDADRHSQEPVERSGAATVHATPE